MRKTKLFIATLAMSMLLSNTSLAGTWQAQGDKVKCGDKLILADLKLINEKGR